MSAVALIRQAQDAGVALRMVGGKLKAVGKLSVVQSWAPRLREHKLELIEALAAIDPNSLPGEARATGNAEVLADKLVTRDRDLDDRRICLECRHLSGVGQTSWRCGNWQAAKVAHRARDVQLPADLVRKLQRCDGFTETTA